MEYTEKAINLFLETGTRFQRELIKAMGAIKYAAAKVNCELNLLEEGICKAIEKASLEVFNGKHDNDVLVDVFQTGSGTGLNMNINEIIARRASDISGLRIHPNDHVNFGQSSNDVVPTAIRTAALEVLEKGLIPTLETFINNLESLVNRTKNVVKAGRTHLRDALPITMGQEFSGFLDEFKHDLDRLKNVKKFISEVPLGGTAVGTGINTHPNFPEMAIREINRLMNLNLKPAKNKFRGMKLLSDLLSLSGNLKTLATNILRLSQDIRLMFSGPFTGLGEIDLSIGVPGSSIMPGKTNPVTVEAALLAAAQVIGLDQANTIANLLGELELSMGIPLIGYNIIYQMKLLTNALQKLSKHVINNITPKVNRCRELAEKSPAIITVIAPIIGYEKAGEVVEKVMLGMNLRDALRDAGFSDEFINDILDLEKLTKMGILSEDV